MLSVCSVVQRPGQLWGCCRPCLLCKPLNAGRGHPSCDRPFHRVGVSVEALSPSLLFRRAPRAKGDFSRPSPLTPPTPSAARSPRFYLTSQGSGLQKCLRTAGACGKGAQLGPGGADGLSARGVSLGAQRCSRPAAALRGAPGPSNPPSPGPHRAAFGPRSAVPTRPNRSSERTEECVPKGSVTRSRGAGSDSRIPASIACKSRLPKRD